MNNETEQELTSLFFLSLGQISLHTMHDISTLDSVFFFLKVHFILLPISAEHTVTFAWPCESDAEKVREQIVFAQCWPPEFPGSM